MTIHDKLISLTDHTRKQIRVSKVLVHANFKPSVNDIALLKLGRRNLYEYPIQNQFSEERVNLALFSPACLPENGESFVGQTGIVYGEQP